MGLLTLARGDSEPGKDEPAKGLLGLAREGKPQAEEIGSPGKAFVKGLVKGATLGHYGDDYEPETTAEKVAGFAGETVPFLGYAAALSPIAGAGVAAMGLEGTLAGAAAHGAIEGAVYHTFSKTPEDQSKLESVVKGAAEWGALGGAGKALALGGRALEDYVGSLGDVSPGKLMEIARRENLNPEQLDELRGATAYSSVKDATAQARGKYGPMPPSAADMRDENFDPRAAAIGGIAEKALKTPPSNLIGPGVVDPGMRINYPEAGIEPPTTPTEIPEFGFKSSKRAEFDPNTPKHSSLVKSGYLTADSELTPFGAQNMAMFDFLKPRNILEKANAVTEKIPSSLDEDFKFYPEATQKFVKNEVEGALGATSDSFGRGATYAQALDAGLQSFAKPRKLEMGVDELKNAMEGVLAKSRLAMNRAKDMMPKLDPENPAMDLAMKANIPPLEAEGLVNDLGSFVREPMGQTAVSPPNYETVPPPKTPRGQIVITPEILDRALAASDVTPEQFRNAGFLQPDGTLNRKGQDLLNVLNPEWHIPYSEKVIDKPPIPMRRGRSGRVYKSFDINSPEGRIGLASVRAGGKGSYPLDRSAIEGLMPVSLEEALSRPTPLARKLPGGGYQFTEAGAKFAANRTGSVIKEIDVGANRSYEAFTDVEGGGGEQFVGGKGGKSFAGMSPEQVEKAKADYNTAKEIVKQYREEALNWKGCPEGEG